MARLPEGWTTEPDGLVWEMSGRVPTDGTTVTLEGRPVAAKFRLTLTPDAWRRLLAAKTRVRRNDNRGENDDARR